LYLLQENENNCFFTPENNDDEGDRLNSIIIAPIAKMIQIHNGKWGVNRGVGLE